MSQKAITIYTPSGAEPHISADDDAFIHRSLLCGRSGMLGGLVCTKADDNTVRLEGGGVSNRGYILRVPDGECCDLTVDNGVSGVNRIDLVAARFTKGGASAADTHEFVVIKGTSAAEPVAPALTESDLLSVGDINEIALFEIYISGTTINAVTPLSVDASVPEKAGGLTDAVKLSLTGDVKGSAFFDGTADTAIAAGIPALEGVVSYHMSLSASQTEAFELIKSRWNTIASGKAFIIYADGGSYGNSAVFFGAKTNSEYGCMLRMSYGMATPMWYTLSGSVWSINTLAKA